MSIRKLETLLVGGGMIAHDQVLPSLYQLQRDGMIDAISVCSRTPRTVKALAENQTIRDAFPGQDFASFPDFRTCPDLGRAHPELYKELLTRLPERSLVVMALPDQLHFECIMAALEAGHHVMAVKPLVLTHDHATRIERESLKRGLFVGVEYHKRFDDRALMARMQYRSGNLGNFRLAQAAMVEPYYYRDSNFQNWCTCENTDLFTYVGCHYVDQVHFVTGHLPVEVSVYGIVDTYPNGRQGYLWTDARVIWDNGGCLSVMDAIGYPNDAAGGNTQGLRMLCQGANDACLLFHDDQYRGVKYCLENPGDGANATRYSEPSPDYFKLVYRGGEGLTAVGYGFRSVEGIAKAILRVEAAGDLAGRQKEMQAISGEGIIATPGNSSYNELVVEAGRLSLENSGHPVTIVYGENPHVELRRWSG